jgi:hypothetical protein
MGNLFSLSAIPLQLKVLLLSSAIMSHTGMAKLNEGQHAQTTALKPWLVSWLVDNHPGKHSLAEKQRKSSSRHSNKQKAANFSAVAVIGSPGNNQHNQGPMHYAPVYVYQK